MKTDIIKELRKNKENQKVFNIDAVKEIQLLLEGDNQEDLRITRAMSPHSVNVLKENKHGQLLELENLEKQYGETFTTAQIKKLAIKYRLKFLKARYFCGNLDIETTAKVKEFSKETKVDLNTHDLANKFFILAPEEMFKLNDVVIEREIPIKNPDPVLFYHIEGDKYRLIHKWGKDFTILRRIQGIIWKNPDARIIFVTLRTILLFSLIIGVIPFFGGINIFHLYPKLSILGIVIVSFISSSVACATKYSNGKLESNEAIEPRYFSEEGWNSPDKLRNNW